MNQGSTEVFGRNSANLAVYGSLFVPFLLSYFVQDPLISWWVSWTGSLWIFYASWKGLASRRFLSKPISERVLRPEYLVQGIFAGYGFLSSLFYYLELSGYTPVGVKPSLRYPGENLTRLSEAQSFYVLAHACLVVGFEFGHKIRRGSVQYALNVNSSLAGTLILLSLISGVLSFVFDALPGLSQFGVKMQQLSVVAGASSFGPALTASGRKCLPTSVVLLVFLLVSALASGWKEEVFVLIILVVVNSYFKLPFLSIISGLILLVVGVFWLPVISDEVRNLTWDEETGEAVEYSRVSVLEKSILGIAESTEDERGETRWRFLTKRLSEVSMFVRYIESVEQTGYREGFKILKQAMLTPVPRVIWRSKPNTEEIVHKRVIRHRIVSSISEVSAKPTPVVDGYLVAGGFGVAGAFLVIGMLSTIAFGLCERLIGGYFVGGVFFNGLFAILWRGNCFEFFVNSMFWSFVLLYLIHFVGVKLGYLRPSSISYSLYGKI